MAKEEESFALIQASSQLTIFGFSCKLARA